MLNSVEIRTIERWGRRFIVAAVICFGLIGCKTSSVRQVDTQGSGVAAEEAGDVDPTPSTVGPDAASDASAETIDVSRGSVEGSGRTDGSIWQPDPGDFVLKDRETGSKWNVRGEAYAGPLKGATLEQLRSFNSFWFAWSRFYDGSTVWRAGESNLQNETSPIDVDSMRLGCPGKDCIPALDYKGRSYAGSKRPKEAKLVEPGDPGTEYLDPRELVAGVVVEGVPRAYPLDVYADHEIHNDGVDGDEFTMTFCPLTGSAIPFDGRFEGRAIRFGVSGRLLHSNLVMFDPESDTFWSQMIGKGVKGSNKGEYLTRLPVLETTWERWKEMYPNTLVTSSDTGYNRNYNNYPYGDYRTNDDTFGEEGYQKTYDPKARVLGLPARPTSKSVAFPFPELEELEGDRNVIHATFRGDPIVVVWEAEHQLAVPFRRAIEVDGSERTLTFVGTVAQ